MSKIFLSALVGVTLLAAPAFAEKHEQADHSKHGSTKTENNSNAVISAFKAANEKMHKGMSAELTGDADVDFVRGMIPHHQGAIDMAKIQLEHGKDPELRKLAQEVIDAQEKEITQMKEWLKSKGHD